MRKHDLMMPLNPVTIDIISGLYCILGEDKDGIIAWLTAKNPNFGNLEPIQLIRMGKANKVQEFVNDALDANGEL